MFHLLFSAKVAIIEQPSSFNVLFMSKISIMNLKSSRVDPDLNERKNKYTIPYKTRLRILLIKVMRICDHWSTDLPRLLFEPPRPFVNVHGPRRLNFDPLKLLNFDFSGDPDQASKNNADRDLQPYNPIPIRPFGKTDKF